MFNEYANVDLIMSLKVTTISDKWQLIKELLYCLGILNFQNFLMYIQCQHAQLETEHKKSYLKKLWDLLPQNASFSHQFCAYVQGLKS